MILGRCKVDWKCQPVNKIRKLSALAIETGFGFSWADVPDVLMEAGPTVPVLMDHKLTHLIHCPYIWPHQDTHFETKLFIHLVLRATNLVGDVNFPERYLGEGVVFLVDPRVMHWLTPGTDFSNYSRTSAGLVSIMREIPRKDPMYGVRKFLSALPEFTPEPATRLLNLGANRNNVISNVQRHLNEHWKPQT